MARKPNRIRDRRRETNVSRRDRVARRSNEIATQTVALEVQEVASGIPPDFTTTISDFEARIAGLENP